MLRCKEKRCQYDFQISTAIEVNNIKVTNVPDRAILYIFYHFCSFDIHAVVIGSCQNLVMTLVSQL